MHLSIFASAVSAPTFPSLSFELSRLGPGSSMLESADATVIIVGTSSLADEFRRLMVSRPTARDLIQFQPVGLGSWIIIDHRNGNAFAAGDLLGTFPLYWASNGQTLTIADELSLFGGDAARALDYAGVVEFLRYGYCIGSRTFFSGVARLRPGDTLSWRSGRSPAAVDRSPLWASVDTRSESQITDSMAELLVDSATGLEDALLMMSAGWDSRTLLAASLGRGNRPRLYSHGNPASRELRIVREIARRKQLKLLCREISPKMFAADELQSAHERYENLVFPHWHAVATLGEANRGVVAGIFGEILGGHYGPPMAEKGLAKAWSFLQAHLGANSASRFEGGLETAVAAAFFQVTDTRAPWYARSQSWLENCGSMREQIAADVSSEMSRYASRGVASVPAAVEAFITEHRGTQYIAAQLRAASASSEFVAPFATRPLIEQACAIPFHRKVHNRLNQKIIQRLDSDLLRYPMAATLCSASRPVLAQEATRFLRKGTGLVRSRLSGATNGRLSPPATGWVDFEVLREGGNLTRLVEGLSLELFDPPKMLGFVERKVSNAGSIHPVVDMLMKIVTVDRACKGRNSDWPSLARYH